ncbi:MAG: DUF3795 domain-containing protein [Candidatus Thorarchaeota archaeon]
MNKGKTVQIKKEISVCGLNCMDCQIYQAPYNKVLANKLVKMFHNMWDNVKPEDFHCSTCRGKLSECWTKECWIRDCCVNDKKLNFCYQCKDFPCKGLEERATKSKRYLRALNDFKKIKSKKK